MTLHQLKVFATVAKFRSFTLAGETLRVRQPSVSLLIKGLERELEVKLFEKLGNKVHLTTVGEALLRDVEEVLAKVEGIKEKMDEIKGLKKGKLLVGGSALAGVSFLPVAVQSFKTKHPGVEVILTIQGTESLEKKLLEGDLDVAILSWTSRSPLLVSEPYRDDPIVAIAPPNHPLAKKRSVLLELIANEPLIAQEENTLIRDMVERRFVERGLQFAPVLQIDARFGGRDAIRKAVASGLGIGFLSKSHVIWDIKAGRLKILKVPELNLKRTMYLTIHKNRKHSPFVKEFINFLRDYKD